MTMLLEKVQALLRASQAEMLAGVTDSHRTRALMSLIRRVGTGCGGYGDLDRLRACLALVDRASSQRPDAELIELCRAAVPPEPRYAGPALATEAYEPPSDAPKRSLADDSLAAEEAIDPIVDPPPAELRPGTLAQALYGAMPSEARESAAEFNERCQQGRINARAAEDHFRRLRIANDPESRGLGWMTSR